MVKSYTTRRFSSVYLRRFRRLSGNVSDMPFFHKLFMSGLFFVAVVLNDAETVLIDDSSESRYDLCLTLKYAESIRLWFRVADVFCIFSFWMFGPSVFVLLAI